MTNPVNLLENLRARGGWPAIVIRAAIDFLSDQIPAVAAGVTFFVLLALFPALSATVSLYGLFARATDARKAVAGLEGLVPSGALTVISDQLLHLTQAPRESLGSAFLLSLAISIWSANAGMKALINGLGSAYEQKDRRGFVRLNGVSLAFTLGAVVSAILLLRVATALPAASGLRIQAIGNTVEWAIILASVIGALSMLYQFGPHRRRRGHWITPGNVVASLAWMGMSVVFSGYIARFGHYNLTYGSLGAVAGFMTWIWLSVMVVLFGAELNAARERVADTESEQEPR